MSLALVGVKRQCCCRPYANVDHAMIHCCAFIIIIRALMVCRNTMFEHSTNNSIIQYGKLAQPNPQYYFFVLLVVWFPLMFFPLEIFYECSMLKFIFTHNSMSNTRPRTTPFLTILQFELLRCRRFYPDKDGVASPVIAPEGQERGKAVRRVGRDEILGPTHLKQKTRNGAEASCQGEV